MELSSDPFTALHGRWIVLLRALMEAEFARGFFHPESGLQTLVESLAYYAWHSCHHTEQVTELRRHRNW